MRSIPLIFLLSLPAFAGLTLPEPVKDYHVPPDAASTAEFSVDFPFTNATAAPLTIRKFNCACSGLRSEITGNKLTYAPGESGVLRSFFTVGPANGTMSKSVVLWLQDDPEETPSATFTARIHVPELVKIEPRTLCWDLGQPAAPQTLRIRIDHEKPILLNKVTCTTENFRHSLRTIEPGKLYEIEAVPVNSAILGLAVLKLETDCPLPRQQLHQAFLVVRKPPARPVAP
jgi:hypothetical protein